MKSIFAFAVFLAASLVYFLLLDIGLMKMQGLKFFFHN